MTITPFTKFGTLLEIIQAFSCLEEDYEAINELEQALYSTEKNSA